MEERFEEAVANNKEEDLNGFAIGVFKTAQPNCFSKFIAGAGIFKYNVQDTYLFGTNLSLCHLQY